MAAGKGLAVLPIDPAAAGEGTTAADDGATLCDDDGDGVGVGVGVGDGVGDGVGVGVNDRSSADSVHDEATNPTRRPVTSKMTSWFIMVTAPMATEPPPA